MSRIAFLDDIFAGAEIVAGRLPMFLRYPAGHDRSGRGAGPINRRTGEPHLALREKARRRFRPGTIGRDAANRHARKGEELRQMSYDFLPRSGSL